MIKNKIILLIWTSGLLSVTGYGQRIAINEDGSAPNPNAILDIKSFTKGILIPRVSTAGRLAIPNTKGLLVYDTTAGSFWYNTGAQWLTFGLGSPSSSSWLLNGNGGLAAKNFLGILDKKPLVFSINGQASGLIDPTSGNTFWGYKSGQSDRPDLGGRDNAAIGISSLSANTSGNFNTAVGTNSMNGNTDGQLNTAVGSFSMFDDGSFQNVAVGDGANQFGGGISNTANGSGALNSAGGFENLASGYNALHSSHGTFDNTAVGHNALFSNTGFGAQFITAIGAWSFYQNRNHGFKTAIGAFTGVADTAVNNTFAGSFAAYSNTSGFELVAFGSQALYANTTGGFSTAIGAAALSNNNTGQDNVAAGAGALSGNITGFNNLAVGHAANVTSGNLNNATVIGLNASVNASNKVRLGNSSVTVIEGQVPFTTPSDGRFKYQVREDVKGLDFIMRLRPVTYLFDTRRFDQQALITKTLSAKDPRIKNVALPTLSLPSMDLLTRSVYAEDASAIRRTGFIAQEVERAADSAGYDFSGVIRPANEQDHYSLSYESFVMPLVKGMQEQQRLIDTQYQKIAALRKMIRENDALSEQVPALEQQAATLHQLVNALQANTAHR